MNERMNEQTEPICIYCGEEAKYKPLIPKPNFFVFETIVHQLVKIKHDNELICLECLDFEIEELKDVY